MAILVLILLSYFQSFLSSPNRWTASIRLIQSLAKVRNNQFSLLCRSWGCWGQHSLLALLYKTLLQKHSPRLSSQPQKLCLSLPSSTLDRFLLLAVYYAVLASFTSPRHKSEASERRDTHLRKCLHKIPLEGAFLICD